MTSEEYEQSQKLISRRMAGVSSPLAQGGTRVMRMLGDFPALWERLTREEKTGLIRKVVQTAWVKDGCLERIEFRENSKMLNSAHCQGRGTL